MQKISFNEFSLIGNEKKYLNNFINSKKISAPNIFSKKCEKLINKTLNINYSLLTNSCTSALEVASILSKIKAGDEVIMPSFTFSSTANSIVLLGGKPVFVDINETTLNIDANEIEKAITRKTKAIIVVHYAGIAADMHKILKICKKYKLLLIEDAAQAYGSFYRDLPLGSIGDYGAISFHHTKNISSIEGGCLIMKKKNDFILSQYICDKGNNRYDFVNGKTNKYNWVNLGSSYRASEVSSSILLAQLEKHENIKKNRINLWDNYHENLNDLEKLGKIQRPTLPDYCQHNGHMYYIVLDKIFDRARIIKKLSRSGIESTFHYIPLHNSPAGLKYGKFVSEMKVTNNVSKRILRLPLHNNLSKKHIEIICEKLKSYLK